MNEKLVYVLTGTELGWDCVIGVFKSEEGLLDYINEGLDTPINSIDDIELVYDYYVVHEEYLHE